MSRPDEGLIHTWLDGECSADEAAEIERLVTTDPAWAAAVAEARGLIAASSRIVSALDAVPARVVPEGSKAAPGVEKIAPASPERPVQDGFRVRPWMKMAAGVVLVAGTAFALRERTREVFGPVTPAVAPAPVVAPAQSAKANLADAVTKAPPARETQGAAPAATMPGDARRVTPRVEPSATPSAPPAAALSPAAEAATTAAPSAPAPTAAASVVERSADIATKEARAARLEAMQRRLQGNPLSQVVTTGTRGAEPERMPDGPSSIAAATRLEGCWNITAPDSMRIMLRHPAYTRASADSIIVVFELGGTRRVQVLQDGDALRGAITAERVECPKP